MAYGYLAEETMSSFTDPLEVRFLGGELWVTLRSFTYWSRCDDSAPELPIEQRCKLRIVVPTEFVTDFGSIPAIAWPLIGHPAGEYVQATVLHDYLYSTRGISRRESDEIFLEAMEVLGVPRWKRSLMWLAVRSAGWIFFKE